MSTKIYTRTGDNGETGFIGGRTSKASNMVNLLGELDELNAALGVAVSNFQPQLAQLQELAEIGNSLQNFIFELGAVVADKTLTRTESHNFPVVAAQAVTEMEQTIDTLQASLPELQNFILPGGSLPSSYLHLARAICRRAERQCVTLQGENADAYEKNILAVQKYLNRLSDLLFTMARSANQLLEVPDLPWHPAKQS